MRSRRIPSDVVQPALFAVIYFIVARFSLALIAQPGSLSIFWPPAGLLLGILVAGQRRDWRWILPLALLAHFAAELWLDVNPWLAAGFSLTEILAGSLGALLLQRVAGRRISLENVGSVLALLLLPMLVTNPLSATLGASVRMLDGGHPGFWSLWLVWWISTSLGITVIAPMVLTWHGLFHGFRAPRGWRILEGLLLSMAFLVACVAIFAFPAYRNSLILPLLCLPFPLFMWAAARFGPAGVSAYSLAFSTYGVWQTFRQRGAIALLTGRAEQNALLLQVYLTVLVCFSLLLAATIFQRERALRSMRESEARYRSLVEHLPVGIAVMVDEVVVYANPAVMDIVGAKRAEELVGRSMWEFVPEAFREIVKQRRAQMLSSGRPNVMMELKLRRLDGLVIDIEGYGAAIDFDGRPGVQYCFRDITERIRAEAALRESEERFRQLTENIREVFWMRTHDFKDLLYISPAYEAVWGQSRGHLIQNPLSYLDAIHPEDRPQAEAAIDRGREAGFEMEYRVIRPDGSIRWIWDRAFPVKDNSGRVYRIAGIAEDISERRLGEDLLKTTSGQLRELMADLRTAREQEGIRIAREIHDELGSAFTSLRWDLEVIDKIVFESGDSPHAPRIRQKIETMLNLIDATINVVRRISSELRPSILDDLGLVEAVEWQLQQFQTRSGITCRFNCAPENLEFDPDQSTAIFRILQEALTNVMRHAEATLIDVTLDEDGTDFVLQVKDNGRGYTEDPEAGAASLGLLGMRERAQLIGGRIELAGTRAGGTTITLRVPCSGIRKS